MKKIISILLFLPVLSWGQSFPVNNLQINGTVSGNVTGSGNVVLATAPTVTLTNASGLPIAGITGLGSGVSSALATPVTGTGGMALSNNPSLSGVLTVTNNASQAIIVSSPSNAGGAQILLQGNGGTTPNKYVRSIGGHFQIVNSGDTGVIIDSDDSGNISFSGTVSGSSFPSPSLTGVPTAPTAVVGNNGTQLATTAFVASHAPCPSIMDNGGNNGGSVDNSAAFAATAALGPSGQVCVYFPPGTYAFSSQLLYTLAASGSITIQGAGQGVTNLLWAGGGGMQISTSNNVNSVHIKDLTVTTGSAGVGIGISLVNTGSSGNAQAALSTIQNVLVQGSGFIQTNYWSAGIKINNISNVNLVNVSVVGANAAYQTNGTGVWLVGASNASQTVQVNLYGCVLQYVGTGLLYGNNVEGVTVTATNFTGDATGITVPTPSGAQSGLSITMSQFNSNVNAILDQAGIDGVLIIGNYFEIPYNGGSTVTGINLAKQSSMVISGNVFERIGTSGTGLNGIVISGPSTLPGVITGNTFESLGTGIWLQTNSDFVNVQSNNYQGNGTNVLNQGNGGVSVCPSTSTANCVGGGSI